MSYFLPNVLGARIHLYLHVYLVHLFNISICIVTASYYFVFI